MIQRVFAGLLAAGVVLGLACVDMSAPKGPASISNLVLPSPSVIVGDVMRDSTGAPAPLSIAAYDANGAPLTGVAAQFFITDSAKVAHLDASNVLTGDQIGTVHIVGQVGALQTSVATVPVTSAPSKMASSGKIDTLVVPLGADSALTTAFAAMSLLVTSAGDSASQGIVVRYSLAYAPATHDGEPTAVYIADNTGHVASADTTSGSGSSSRRLVVTSAFLADDALRGGQRTDSAVVEASASYKGAALAGSPVRFVVPIKVALKLQ